MKITWNWLNEYVELLEQTPQQVAADLTRAGIPVESMWTFAPDVSGVVVGHVEEVLPHPNADRMRICRVNIGEANRSQIVCGAANVAAGQKVPVATVGAQLPSGSILAADKRGVRSEGMICSAQELGLDAKLLPKSMSEGILVLPDDAPIGVSIVSYLGLDDTVMELELTPNRADCLSLRGVAYEVAAIYGKSVHMPPLPVHQPRTAEAIPLHVAIETSACSFYATQVIDHVANRPSPIAVQMRLLAVGVRPIDALVDATNYVMLEWGQPLHAFDCEAIHGETIVVRQARTGEKLVTLDGRERQLEADMIVIADAQHSIGLAGVMGGANSEIGPETRRVALESARFDAQHIRRTARDLNLRSEASARFEKGVDTEVLLPALARAVSLIVAWTGGVVASEVIAQGDGDRRRPAQIQVHPSRVCDVLGFTVPTEQMRAICSRLGFEVVLDGAVLRITPSTRRPDVTLEEDMIEEFARLVGYDQIPSTLPTMALAAGHLTDAQQIRRTVRQTLMGFGMQEVWTYALQSPHVGHKLRLPNDHPLAKTAPLLNPLSDERQELRTLLLPALLDVAGYNAKRQHGGFALFEIGAVFTPRALPVTELPREERRLIGLFTGLATEQDPQQVARSYDFYDAKAHLQGVFARLGIKDVSFHAAAHPYLHGGIAADVTVGGETVGYIGRVHDLVVKAFDAPACVAFEVSFDALIKHAKRTLAVTPLPRFPAVERDLAFVVSRSMPAQKLLDAIRSRAGEQLVSVRIFDVYVGERVRASEKSVALRMVFRDTAKTMSEEDIAGRIDAIIAEAHAVCGAVLRS
ncbi:phenylalanine--tRNA ligase subunit beta [Ferroacidibacillus organovorans]|nr:phenylalanine--tRNA ligase subunit beta [Ferroacidibacillus organovorans]KYP81579.1 hypothetical protein AYJ22_07065 [Ferroacidibacillus organovorans]OAG94086.1 hypothetical protein AYW79_07040 [Ferroacidibacillus organovorans]